LLEGDAPTPPQTSGPGRKFALGQSSWGDSAVSTEAELPEAYGTGRFWLAARDPHCLYAHWDLTGSQQRQFNAESVHQHLLVRVYRDHAEGRPLNEIHVHPESRHWFIHVEHGGANYMAELGFYATDGHWRRVALSERVGTPPDTRAAAGVAQFGTIVFAPPPVTRGERTETRSEQSCESVPLGQPARPRSDDSAAFGAGVSAAMFPAPGQWPSEPRHEREQGKVSFEVAWTTAQSEMIAELSGWTTQRTQWLDSVELTELVRGVTARRIARPLAPAELAPSSIELGISSPGPEVAGEVSSPFGGELPAQRQFWFNVNAELVIYGATEPDAVVTIGNRPIRLRADGTFSYRFALPDGTYDLPITATAAHGDSRHAHLRFHRGTAYSGQVGVHPQDPALRTPDPRHVA
jgi:hypothetical protein